jgi:hypothetical protein
VGSGVTDGVVGLAIVLAAVAVLAHLVRKSRLRRSLKILTLTALGLRVVGAFVYYGLFELTSYSGGDYNLYHSIGLEYARRIAGGDFSMFTDSGEWFGGAWTGTQFPCFSAGIIAAVLGPNLLAQFIIFSLLAFVGLVGLAIAFRRSYPDVPVERYARWIWLFPSLWFWSATLGKDALLLCGVGVATCGFVGFRGRINWLLLALGTLLIFAVRPQVAAVVMLALVVAQWVARARQWTVAHTIQTTALVVLGLAAIHLALGSAGAGGLSGEGVGAYAQGRAERAAEGGTNVGEAAPGIASAPFALANILFRPLPWEATSVTTLIASAEIWGLWTVAFLRRKVIWAALKEWRSNRLLTFSLIFTLLYAASLGMVIVNMGIIARQRIVLFPFIFILFEAKAGLLTASRASSRVSRRARRTTSPSALS